jgi:glucose-6-phosphate isomerase
MARTTDTSVSPFAIAMDLQQGRLNCEAPVHRYLSDLQGFFFDSAAYEAALAREDALVYQTSAVTSPSGPGDLHIGLGTLFPGRIGDEYFFTKGHLHERREAAEIYIGLEGTGVMLLEDEATGDSQMLPLEPHRMVYVPGHTAHRTCNIGDWPLKYLGIYPADAGHDYGAIARRNFHKRMVAHPDGPRMVDRNAPVK